MKTSLRTFFTTNCTSVSSFHKLFIEEDLPMKNFSLPIKYFKSLFIFLSFLFFAFWANAGTITSTAVGGNWNTAGTWVGGVVPLSTDNVIIDGPVIVNNGSTITCFDLQINNGITFTLGNKNFTVNGTVTIQGNGLITLSGQSLIYGTTKTLIYTDAAAKVVGGEWPSTSGPTSVFINNSFGVTSTATRTITNLTIGNTTSNSIFNDGGFQLTATGTFTLTSGTFNIGLGATATAYPNFGTNNILAGTTVNYNSTSAQIISSGVSGINYANLQSVNGPRTLGTSGIIGISGTFTPGSGAYTIGTSTVNFNGTIAQTIPSFTPARSFYNLIISNAAGISSIASDVTVTNSLALTSGVVTTGANKIIIPNLASAGKTNGWVNGNLQQYIPSAATSNFYVGNATVYRPVTINFAAGSTAGDLTVVQLGGFHPQIASSGLDNTTPKTITPYWNLTASGGLAGTYDATFTFVAGDVPVAATTSNFIIRKYSASWATTIAGIRTATSTQATGLTSFGDFCIGEIFAVPTVSTQPVNTAVCLGNNTSFTSASTSTPTTTVQWQRSTNGTTWFNIIATTDGSKYTNFTTNTLTITGPDYTMNGYQYRSVYTNINGGVNSTAVTLTVTKIPTITTLSYAGSPFADITTTPQSVTLLGTNAYTGGTYTSDAGLTINSATGAITPASPSTLGDHTVTYTIAAAGGCGLVSATTVINITSAPTASIAYPANSYCISDNSTYAATLTGTGNFNNGGTGFYSVSPASGLLVNSSTGAITPNGIAGTYTVTYNIPATTSPTFPASTSNKVIIITPIPTATITYTAGPFCTSDQTAKTVTLNGTGAFSSGVFSASPSGLVLNTTTGAFTPNGSTVNNYTITYTIPASGGCAAVPVTATAFNIVAAPTASITYNGGKPYCQAITTPQAVTLIGASGGSFSFTPTGLTIDAAGAITPSTSIAGDYIVTYTILASGPCGIVQITTTVTISETPTGNISYPLQPYCTSDPAKTVSFIAPTGLYAGGVFSSTPGGLSINASTGTITPASSTPNSYTVNYNTPNGCTVIFTTPVQVDGSPTATISYAGTPFCITDGSSKAVTLGGTGTFTGGNYSSTIGLSIDGVNGDITPSTSTAGTYIVTYTIIPASPNCASITTTTSVTITPAVGVPTAITISSGAEPTCQLTNGTTTTTYASTATNSTGFNWSLSNGSAGSISAAGVMTWANGFFGSVDIQVTANGCNGLSAQVIKSVTVNANNSVSAASTTPTLCINTVLTDITHTTTGATGVGAATNLPAGVTAVWAANIITISGAPTASGTFNYTIPLTGGCSAVSATGTITVSPNNTVSAASSTPILCINTALTNLTHTTTGATGIGTATGLPAGVTAAWAANTITISGTTTASGTFNYTIPLTGGCSAINATGTITVNPNNIVSAASSTPTLCINTALTNITHTTTGATGIGTVTNLPAGVTAAWSGNTITISGTPIAAGSFNYTIPLTGGCGAVNAVGTINVTAATIAGTLFPSIASPLTICAGANSGTITLSGNNGTVTQWETSINGGAVWAIIGNSGNSTLNYSNLTQTTLYRVLVTNGTCTGVYSDLGELVVLPAFSPTITPSPTATCIGVPITLTASGYSSSGLVIPEGDFPGPKPQGWTGMSGNGSNNSSNGDQIWGITNNPDTYYGVTYGSATSKFMITNGASISSLTTPVFSTVGMSSAVLVFNEGYTFIAGVIAKIEISTTGIGGPWTTLKNYTVPNTSAGSKDPFPLAAGIDLNAYLGLSNLVIRFNYQGAASSVWALDNVVVTNTISNPTGTNVYNPLYYTWSPTTDLSTPNTNTTTPTVTYTPTIGNGTGVKSYTVSASVGSCVATTTSLAVNITVNGLPTITTTGITAAVCFNAGAQNATMPYTATTNSPTSYSITWTGIANQGNTAFAFAAGGGTLTGIVIPAGTAAGTYTGTMTITNANGCTKTQTVSVTVNGLPTITTTGIATAVCFNAGVQTTTMPYTATTNSPTSYSIVWTGITNQGNTAFAFAAGGGTFTGIIIPSGTAAGTYTGTMTVNNANGCTKTQAVSVTVNGLPTITTTGIAAAVCFNAGVQTTTMPYTATTNSPTSYSIVWTGLANQGNTAFAFVAGGGTLTGIVIPAGTTAGTYSGTLTVANGNSCVSSAVIPNTVTVNDPVAITTQPATSGFCLGSNSSITVTAGGTAPTYQWQESTTGISGTYNPLSNSGTYSGVTTATLIFTNPAIGLSNNFYRVVVTGTCGSVTSIATTLKFTNVWTGATNTDWNTNTNWSDNLLPSTSCDNVYIQNILNRQPILSNNNPGVPVITNLVIEPGATLTVINDAILKIGGSINNSGLFDVRGGTLEFNGAAVQNISGSMFVANTIKNLTVSNATPVNGLTVSNSVGILLNITGTLSFGNLNNATLNTGDNVVLISSATATARVADITNNGTSNSNNFVGKVTVERYYPAKRAWRLVTSPLSSAGNIFDSWQVSGNYIVGRGMFVTGPNPTGNTGNGLDTSYFNNFSMRGVNAANTAYQDVSDTKNTLLSTPIVTPGKATNIGYYTFVRGDRRRGPLDNTVFGNTNNTTLRSMGFLQTGTQTFDISSGNATFPLIGNPYASAVDFEKITKTNVDPNLFYVHDPTINALGAFVTMVYSGGAFIPVPNNATVQTKYIQSSQAFFVRVTGAGASVTFHENAKSNDDNRALFRPVNPTTKSQSFSANLMLLNANNTTLLADGNLIQFDDQYKAIVDIQDALKFTNINENLGIIRDSKYLAVERRPLIKDTDTIFFKLTKTTQRSYRMEFTPTNLDPLLTAFLEDSFTGSSTPLSVAAASKYDFAITGDAKSSVEDRFRIVFKLLPPVMTNTIKAYQKAYSIAVEWTVENERNISKYEVEKSADGVNFAKANITVAKGSTQPSITYGWMDINPLSGDNYYRVRSISNNGKIDYTKAVVVTMGKMGSGIRIYPNPVTDGVIGAEFKNMAAGIYPVRLLNSQGQTILNKTINHARGTSMEYIQPDYKLIPGIYQLEVTAPDKSVTMVKVIVK